MTQKTKYAKRMLKQYGRSFNKTLFKREKLEEYKKTLKENDKEAYNKLKHH